MGGGFWDSPEVQGGIVPFAVSLLLVVAIRLAGGRDAGSRWAVIAVPLAFLLAYALLESIAWPAVASKQKVFYIAVLALIIGLVVALAGASKTMVLAGAGVFALVSLIWLAIRTLGSGPSIGDLITLVVLLLVSVFLAWRLRAAENHGGGHDESDRRGRIHAPAILLVLSFAAGLISLAGAFIGMAQLAIGLGAILGAFLLISFVFYVRGQEPLPFGALGTLAAGGALLACLYVMVLFAGAVSRPALAILLLAIPADSVARRLRFGTGTRARIVEPVGYGAVIATPAVAAVIFAFATAESESGY